MFMFKLSVIMYEFGMFSGVSMLVCSVASRAYPICLHMSHLNFISVSHIFRQLIFLPLHISTKVEARGHEERERERELRHNCLIPDPNCSAVSTILI